MKHSVRIASLMIALALPHTGHAADCYADYKAKQDNPLRLHYGVAAVRNCSPTGAQAELSARLAAQGWTLLNIMSVFDDSGLEERKQSAGSNFLRF
ncbi:hypothetical protein [Roseobacter sp.]|uniref:hypothetical protein n=1 Tax=Roseobacter sp. TaxID=1907202 RepID=UPI003297A1F1